MTQEEKAKAYDSMFERLKEMYNNNKTNVADRLIYERYFPELKESENKRMIQYFKDLAPFDKADELYEKYGFSHKDAIAWLEKQCEHANFLSKIQVGDKVTRNEDGVLVNLSQLNRVAKKQGEQKSYASETMNEKGDFDNSFTRMMEKEQNFAWSEEDEERLDSIIESYKDLLRDYKACHDVDYIPYNSDTLIRNVVDDVNFLKSLKDRYTWKPSDEHYELEEFAKIVRGNLTGISKAVQKLFEAKYLQLTGNKMYGGFKD